MSGLSERARNESPEERLVELRRKKREDTLLVHEIYASVQGESTHAGRPCIFVRTTGCHLRCGYCDTEHAFHEGKELTVDEVVAAVAALKIPLVELTGGEPLLQKSALTLVKRLLDDGKEVLIETSGGVSIEGVDARAKIILDIKTPGSGESERNVWKNLERLVPGQDEIKLVLVDAADYEWAKQLSLPAGVTVLYSPCWGSLNPTDLAEWITRDRLSVRFQLQLHKVLWGERSGV